MNTKQEINSIIYDTLKVSENQNATSKAGTCIRLIKVLPELDNLIGRQAVSLIFSADIDELLKTRIRLNGAGVKITNQQIADSVLRSNGLRV